MSDYSKGKIYIIKSTETDQIYIGSTIQTLSERLTKHKNCYKSWLNGNCHYKSSYEIVKFPSRIELIQNFPCDNKQELERKEGEYILEYKNKYNENCVNRLIAGRTKKEYRKEYNEANRDKISEQMKATIQCPNCHEVVNKAKISRHKRSAKCQQNTKAILVFED